MRICVHEQFIGFLFPNLNSDPIKNCTFEKQFPGALCPGGFWPWGVFLGGFCPTFPRMGMMDTADMPRRDFKTVVYGSI